MHPTDPQDPATYSLQEWLEALKDLYSPGEIRAMRKFWLETRALSPRIPDRVPPRSWIRLGEGEPVQYVLGKAWFHGLCLEVGPSVLIPRPETEELVDWMLEDLNGEAEFAGEAVWDIGTGSGCIALALAAAIPGLRVRGSDKDLDVLKVAKSNAVACGLENRVSLDLYDFMEEEVPVPPCPYWVSNPPYIGTEEADAMDAVVLKHEPHLALFAPGDHPITVYRRLATKFLKAPHARSFWLEMNPLHAESCRTLWPGCRVTLRHDMQGKARMLKVTKAGVPPGPAGQFS